MAITTLVLIVVAALAGLVLAGVLALVVYKTRTQQRHGKGETLRDQAGEDELRLRHQEARSHAALVEVDIKTARGPSPHTPVIVCPPRSP